MKKKKYSLTDWVSHLKLLFVTILWINVNYGNAQSENKLNKDMDKIAKSTSIFGWIDFKTESNINPHTIFDNYKSAFELGNDDQMKLIKSSTDKKIGNYHYVYNQYYKGVIVDGGEYTVHQNSNGKVYCANGKLAKDLDLSVTPLISENVALELLLSQIPEASSGAWNDARMEEELKERLQDPLATYYPKGELMIHRIDLSGEVEKRNLTLVWKFEITLTPIINSRIYFVDANTGLLINSVSMSSNCNTGTVNTIYYGNQDVYTYFYYPTSSGSDPGIYILKDNCSSHPSYNIVTKNANFNSPLFAFGSTISDSDNDWAGNEAQSGARAHWCTENADKYYRSIHSRASFDDSNGDINVLANFDYNSIQPGCPGENASWSEGALGYHILTVGYGANQSITSDDFAILDIIGHELTHGVSNDETGWLGLPGETGAINESISDCFGEAIENYILGPGTGIPDWHNGTELGTFFCGHYQPPRSLGFPDSTGQPDTYLNDPDWKNTCGTCDDNGGVHTNLGVGNKWFYLLSVGGSGTNNNGESYSVIGIGIENAADIIYHALTAHYLNSTTKYPDYREATIRAAEDLFGNCSNEVIQVGNAWYAVGVATNLTVYNREFCGTFDGLLIDRYRAVNSIVASKDGCASSVNPIYDDIVFSAGNFITLKEGFIAQYSGGNTFTAMIDECAVSVYLRTRSNSLEEVKSFNDVKNNSYKLYPNPAHQQVTLLFYSSRIGNIEITVIDVLGRHVKKYKSISAKGENRVELGLGNVTPGLYNLLIVQDDNRTIERVVIE